MAENTHIDHVEWAFKIACQRFHDLGAIRDRHDIEVCRVDDVLWLHGKTINKELKSRLRGIPDGTFYEVDSHKKLIPENQILFERSVPPGPWIPLEDWLLPQLPPAKLAGEPPLPISLTLKRSTVFSEPSMLRTTREGWYFFGRSAPKVRLERLKFAVSSANSVLICGLPLPPIEGDRFVIDNGICVPAGWMWSPTIDSLVIRDALQLYRGDLAIFSKEEKWRVISGSDFVHASRSAILNTFREKVNE